VYDRVGLFFAVASILLMMMSQTWTIVFGTVVAAFGCLVLALGLPIRNVWARGAIAAAAVAFSGYVGGRAMTKPEPVVIIDVRPFGLVAGHGVGAPGVAPWLRYVVLNEGTTAADDLTIRAEIRPFKIPRTPGGVDSYFNSFANERRLATAGKLVPFDSGGQVVSKTAEGDPLSPTMLRAIEKDRSSSLYFFVAVDYDDAKGRRASWDYCASISPDGTPDPCHVDNGPSLAMHG
jgi:hypothetical protein